MVYGGTHNQLGMWDFRPKGLRQEAAPCVPAQAGGKGANKRMEDRISRGGSDLALSQESLKRLKSMAFSRILRFSELAELGEKNLRISPKY